MKTITTYDELIQDLINDKITMVPFDLFKTVLRNFSKINEIDGDIVECGCWRGGFSIFLSHVFQDRNIWVSDSFEGFQPLENAKYNYDKERHTSYYTHNAIGPLAISLEEVQSHFKNYNLEDQDRIKFLKGFVKNTLPTSGIEKIALLRIDVDAFSATLEVLEELYDKVQPGGYIIFDDACLYETFDAIKVFFNQRNLPKHLYHYGTDEKLDLNLKHCDNATGFPSGCYFIKP